MMPFYGTKESAGWLIGGPGCGFAANASSKNLDAVKKVLAAISTTDGQNALWQNNQGGSSYLNGVEFDLPEAYTSVAGALAAGNVYCHGMNGVLQQVHMRLMEQRCRVIF